MDWFLENACIIPLIPAASFFLILLFGKRLPERAPRSASPPRRPASRGAGHQRPVARPRQRRRARTKRSARRGEEAARRGRRRHRRGRQREAGRGRGRPKAARRGVRVEPITESWTWWSSGGIEFTVGMLLDGPAVMMLFVVTLISLLVHVYSTDYVHGDRRYTHYFAFLSLFTASMLGLVMARAPSSCSPAGSSSACARSRSSGTGGRRSRTPTRPSRRSSPTASATSA